MGGVSSIIFRFTDLKAASLAGLLNDALGPFLEQNPQAFVIAVGLEPEWVCYLAEEYFEFTKIQKKSLPVIEEVVSNKNISDPRLFNRVSVSLVFGTALIAASTVFGVKPVLATPRGVEQTIVQNQNQPHLRSMRVVQTFVSPQPIRCFEQTTVQNQLPFVLHDGIENFFDTREQRQVGHFLAQPMRFLRPPVPGRGLVVRLARGGPETPLHLQDGMDTNVTVTFPGRNCGFTMRFLNSKQYEFNVPDNINQIRFQIDNVFEPGDVKLFRAYYKEDSTLTQLPRISELLGNSLNSWTSRNSRVLDLNNQETSPIRKLLELLSDSVLECSNNSINKKIDSALKKALIFSYSFPEVREVYQNNLRALAYDLLVLMSGEDYGRLVMHRYVTDDLVLIDNVLGGEPVPYYIGVKFKNAETNRGVYQTEKEIQDKTLEENTFISSIYKGEKLESLPYFEEYLQNFEKNIGNDWIKCQQGNNVLSTSFYQKYFVFCETVNSLEKNPEFQAKIITDYGLGIGNELNQGELSLESLLKIYTKSTDAPSIQGEL